MDANMCDEQGGRVAIRVLVDKERSKVVYAEAGNDFVDVVFSFLTLPLGTIVRFMEKETDIEPVKVGSLSSLYESVADLDENYLWTPTCKEMLLKPRNSMEAYCRCLKLNIDDTEPLQYFTSEQCTCGFAKCLTTFRNQISRCRKPMNYNYNYKVMSPVISSTENGFVVETATFIITDDLQVRPNDIETSVSLLQMNGNNDIESMEIKSILIGKEEVFDLLKLSLITKTPLTDFIFKKKQFLCDSKQSEYCGIKKVESCEEGRKMDLKLMVRKSTGEILFGEANKDFADFLVFLHYLWEECCICLKTSLP